MSGAFRWVFIGTGTLARKVAEEITASGRHSIAAVYSRNAENRAAFAARYGALDARSAGEAIASPDADGVYVVTPHTSHCEYALAAMKAGRPVLCEKPVTTDARQAETMIRTSEETGVYFAEAMWTWFSPIANQVKRWLDSGAYGEITKVRMTYHMRGITYAPRVSDPLVAGGALLDVGVYPLTYIYRLFGMPEKISCRGIIKNGIDTGEDILLTYPGGKEFSVSTSIVDFKGLETLWLEGTGGKTRLPLYHMADSVTLKRRGGKSETFSGYGGMLNEFDLAADEIRRGLTDSRLVPHRATLDVMRLMDACREQMGLVYPFETAVGVLKP